MAQPLEASPCIQRMAPPHVHDITVEPFEEVGDDKGLSSFHEGYRILTQKQFAKKPKDVESYTMMIRTIMGSMETISIL